VIALLPVALVGVGVVLLAVSLRSLFARARESRWGTLEAVDTDAGGARSFVSERYRLTGRPDALRRRPDGRLVPVELKHRSAPPQGPFWSHQVQVWAYCLLVEETEGRPPPFGVLRYRDAEFQVPWDAAARSELLRLLRAASGPYDGRATPSPGRCRGCRWSTGCDARIGTP
jgi:CRISPR-associated exonuclease Cas4